MKARKHLILLVLLFIGIAASIWTLSGRIPAEQANHTYDIVLDYSSVEEMAAQSGEDCEFWLRHFASLGVDKLGLEEVTLTTLQERHPATIFASDVKTALSHYGWQQTYPEALQTLAARAELDDGIVICSDPEMAQWIADCFAQRCSIPVTQMQTGNGNTVFFLTGDGTGLQGTDLLELPLGLDPETVALAQACGYTLIPRSTPVEQLNGMTYAQDLLDGMEALGSPYLILTATQFPGLDTPEEAFPAILEHLEKTGSTLAVVETSQQSMNLVDDTLTELIDASGDNAVRVFSMWNYIQWRYQWYGYEGSEEVVNCLYRAVYERNCRLVYLKMMTYEPANKDNLPEIPEYITEPEAYTELLTDFSARMTKLGYTQQTIGSMGHITVRTLQTLLIAAGAIAGAVLLLGYMLPLKEKWLWLCALVGILGAAGALVVMPGFGRLLLSMGGGIVMPLLAIVLLARYCAEKKRRGNLVISCLLAVVGTTLIALVGGLFACAPLSDSSYMLEMKLYRGVKFMQIIPLGVFLCFFPFCQLHTHCQRFLQMPKQQRRETVDTLLDAPIRIRHLVYGGIALVAAALVGLVGIYYLARTGHTAGASVSSVEMMLRNFLEQQLPARPRTKEFLVGYPCIMLYVWCQRRSLKWVSLIPGLGAVIGLTSVVNTFLHIRTTFLLSLTRVGIGLVLGVIIGLIVLALAELLYRAIQKRGKHV